jgi:hypothetical protein
MKGEEWMLDEKIDPSEVEVSAGSEVSFHESCVSGCGRP